MAEARLIYDDDCGFCTRAAFLVVEHGAAVDLIAFSELTPTDEARLPPDWRECAHLLTDEERYSCGEAMTRVYEQTDLPLAGLLPYLRRLPGFATLRELAYRVVANNRPWFSRRLS